MWNAGGKFKTNNSNIFKPTDWKLVTCKTLLVAASHWLMTRRKKTAFSIPAANGPDLPVCIVCTPGLQHIQAKRGSIFPAVKPKHPNNPRNCITASLRDWNVLTSETVSCMLARYFRLHGRNTHGEYYAVNLHFFFVVACWVFSNPPWIR